MRERADRFVVSGNLDRALTHIITELLKPCLPEEVGLEIQSSPYGEEILVFAEREEPDLFVFLFNNVMFSTATPVFPNSTLDLSEAVLGDNPCRFAFSLEMISHVKNTFKTPMLVLSGHNGDPPLTKYLEGIADVLSPFPFNFEALKSRIRNLIEAGVDDVKI